MIKSVIVTNNLGESIEMELRSPEKSGFLITDIDGIGPGSGNINITELATMDGGIYDSARLPSRNIVLNIRFYDEYETVETLRMKSYKYFPIKKEISLTVVTDSVMLRTSGFVEKNEPNIFSNEEGTQISIICPDPNLYLKDPSIKRFNTIRPLFQFPFKGGTYIESVSDLIDDRSENIIDSNNDPILLTTYELTHKIKMSLMDLSQYQTLYYSGHEDVGIEMRFHFLGVVTNPTIYNITKNKKMSINTEMIEKISGSGIIFGDDIVISTVKGKKSIVLIRNGEYFNIFNCLDKDTSWITLSHGENILYITSDSGIEYVNLTIVNDIVYEGV